MNDILLTDDEMLAFNVRLSALTDDRVTVGPRAITRGEARALWSTMKVFNPHSVLTKRLPQRRSRLVHRGGAAFTLITAAALTGCTTLGGNVKGSFACRAPDGMCAPTSKIDDQALAMISGADADAMPATVINPYERTDPRFIPTASASPSRSNERVLRIVFPAHVDRLGRFREASAIHAVVERGSWVTPAKSASAAASNQQLAMVDIVPSLAERAAASPEAVFTQAPVEAVAAAFAAPSAVPGNVPDPAAVAAARRKGHAVKARAAFVRTSSIAGPQPVAPTRAPTSQASTVLPMSVTLPKQIARLEAADRAPKLTSPVAQMPTAVAASAASYDLRGAGAAAPLQSIRDQVGSILAAKTMVRTASAAPKAGAPERPINGPSVLSVSGVEK